MRKEEGLSQCDTLQERERRCNGWPMSLKDCKRDLEEYEEFEESVSGRVKRSDGGEDSDEDEVSFSYLFYEFWVLDNFYYLVGRKWSFVRSRSSERARASVGEMNKRRRSRRRVVIDKGTVLGSSSLLYSCAMR